MSKLAKPRSAKGLAVLCAKIADEKLAEDIFILNLSAIDTAPADFFVICSCNSDTQVRAIYNAMYDQCKSLKIPLPKVEGLDNAEWVILDFFDVVFHAFLPEKRAYYKLEKLWGDAKFLKLDDDSKPVALKHEELKGLIN